MARPERPERNRAARSFRQLKRFLHVINSNEVFGTHNRILLENYYLPGDLDRQIGAFVEHYNHVRYHASIDNVTPADVYFGRADMIIAERHRIKLATIANRRLQHRLQAV
jgi:transposase InsO family protein